MVLELHPAAEAEARAAWLRYRAFDPAVATRFVSSLDRALAQIDEQPERWPTYQHGTRRYVMRRFPFTIIYRCDAARILIVAVAHQKRRPGYWTRRK